MDSRLTYILAVLLYVTLLFPTEAQSTATTFARVTDPFSFEFSDTHTGGAGSSISKFGAGYGVAAGALPGSLGAAVAVQASGGTVSGSAGASFDDPIHALYIGPGPAPTGLVQWRVQVELSGTLAAFGGPYVNNGPDAQVIFDLFIDHGRVFETQASVLSCELGVQALCSPAHLIRYTFFADAAGFTLGASLNVFAKATTSCNQLFSCLLANPTGHVPFSQAESQYGDTALIFIEPPAGFTFTADSGATYSAVPEPSTMVLLVSGLMGLTAWRSRKRAA